MLKRVLLTIALLAPGLALAVPLPPAGFNPDTGEQLFNHTSGVIVVELHDAGEILTPPDGYQFGFYFASDPNTLITIFDANDAAGVSSAFIDFNTGSVLDVDGNVVQDNFAASADPIGFWLELDNSILYTESALNAGMFDAAFAFQSQSDPFDYLIGFEAPDGSHLSIQILEGLQATPTPEPGTVLLIGAGLMLMGIRRRRTH